MAKESVKNTIPGLSKNATTVLEKRYLRRDVEGKVLETPADMFRRVADTIAAADKKFDKKADVKRLSDTFYNMMTSFEFLPNSPTLMNAGRPLGQLSACFVLPVGDSMEEIFDAVKYTALIHKSGGGTGFSFSRLRPANDVVSSTTGISSGPLSFMRVFDIATETIKQGGTRRGANMAILRVDHPNIMDFIMCKADQKHLNNFNISVGMTENFMKAVEHDEEYDLINPRDKKVCGTLNARKVFQRIVKQAWENGEPGIIFLDRLNRDNPTPLVGEIESTNPCGEQPLLPYESCNLGSINMGMFVKDGAIDWKKLKEVMVNSVHFLDNVIEANNYPLQQIHDMTHANRKIGLGLMGWADMLIMLGIPYCSEEAVKLGKKVMKFINDEGHLASQELAKKRGSFPNYKGSIFDKKGAPPMRNATVTTIAPTGTISIIANASSGVEPLFAVSYIRTVMDKNVMVEVNPMFEKIAKERGFYSEELMKKIAEHGTVADIPEVPADVRDGLCHGPRHHPQRPHPDAVGLPAAHRQRRQQDGQLPQHRHHRRRGKRLHAGLRDRLQGCHHLPRRLPRRAGALHRPRRKSMPPWSPPRWKKTRRPSSASVPRRSRVRPTRCRPAAARSTSRSTRMTTACSNSSPPWARPADAPRPRARPSAAWYPWHGAAASRPARSSSSCWASPATARPASATTASHPAPTRSPRPSRTT